MGKWLFRKPEPFQVQGVCVSCKQRRQKKKGAGFTAQCSTCYKKRWKHTPNKTVKFKRSIKKSYCEKCSFKAEHSCQLDIDHIDGNRNNNNLENLQTLCANCHRLKTWYNKDWEIKKATQDFS